MNANDRELLFETYKLHAELAERVAALREGLNKLYSGMVVGIVAASVLLHRLAPNAETTWLLPIVGNACISLVDVVFALGYGSTCG